MTINITLDCVTSSRFALACSVRLVDLSSCVLVQFTAEYFPVVQIFSAFACSSPDKRFAALIMSIPSTEITDFLVHHIFSDFPVNAKALWEITPDTETDERPVGERTRVTAVAVAGGIKGGKKRKTSVGVEMNRLSAHVLGVDEKWWAFVMRGF